MKLLCMYKPVPFLYLYPLLTFQVEILQLIFIGKKIFIFIHTFDENKNIYEADCIAENYTGHKYSPTLQYVVKCISK